MAWNRGLKGGPMGYSRTSSHSPGNARWRPNMDPARALRKPSPCLTPPKSQISEALIPQCHGRAAVTTAEGLPLPDRAGIAGSTAKTKPLRGSLPMGIECRNWAVTVSGTMGWARGRGRGSLRWPAASTWRVFDLACRHPRWGWWLASWAEHRPSPSQKASEAPSSARRLVS